MSGMAARAVFLRQILRSCSLTSSEMREAGFIRGVLHSHGWYIELFANRLNQRPQVSRPAGGSNVFFGGQQCLSVG